MEPEVFPYRWSHISLTYAYIYVMPTKDVSQKCSAPTPLTVARINGGERLILGSLISESREYYGTLCESTFQSDRRCEWELTLLALMSGNIISSTVRDNGVIVFGGEWSLSVEDRKWRKIKEWNKSEFNLLCDKGEILLKIVCFNNWIKACVVECIFF